MARLRASPYFSRPVSMLSVLSDSTSSLFSVLDHDSFEEDEYMPNQQTEEVIMLSPVRIVHTSVNPGIFSHIFIIFRNVNLLSFLENKGPDVKEMSEELEKSSHSKETSEKEFNESVKDILSTDRSSIQTNSADSEKMGDWEKWLVDKIKKERQAKRLEGLKARKIREKMEVEKAEKEKMSKTAKEKYAAQQKEKRLREERRQQLEVCGRLDNHFIVVKLFSF